MNKLLIYKKLQMKIDSKKSINSLKTHLGKTKGVNMKWCHEKKVLKNLIMI